MDVNLGELGQDFREALEELRLLKVVPLEERVEVLQGHGADIVEERDLDSHTNTHSGKK